PVVGDRLVEESDRQAVQRGVLDGWLPVEGPAAPLRSGFHLQVLRRRNCYGADEETALAAASHRLRDPGSGEDAAVLRRRHRASADGNLVRVGRAVWQGAHLRAYVLRDRGRRRAG